MIDRLLDDSAGDPRLADAFRRRDHPHSPGSEEELRARILRAAGPRLALLRERPRTWWEWTATWARILVPAGFAASLAAGVLLVRYDAASGSNSNQEMLATARSLMFGLVAGTTAPEAVDELVARPSDDWLLSQAMNRQIK